MKNLIILLFAIIVCQSIEAFNGLPRPENYVVNGTDIEIEDIPYQISLRRFGSHICGGTILNDRIILTAAHCLYPLTAELIVLYHTIRVGHTHRDQGTEYHLENALVHDGFTEEMFQFDVALLKLSSSLEFGLTVQPVVLAESDFQLQYGHIGVVSGWGRLWHGGPLADVLQAADVEFLDTARCRENYLAEGYLITSDMFCAGSFYGKVDNCHGDSGGPLTYEGRQIGVVSWGLDCAQHDFPGVYASVWVLREWIDLNVELL